MSKKIPKPRVYVAGPYSCKNYCPGISVSLVAMREGIQACMALIHDDMIPFCPWLDFMLALMDHEGTLPKTFFYEYSNAFLVVCDAVYIHKFVKSRTGILNEMILADKNNIPVINDYMKLIQWRNKWIKEQGLSRH